MAKTPTDIRSLARSHTRLAIGTLVGVMVNQKAMSSARVAAAREMLNRGWGAPEGEGGNHDNRIIVNILKLSDAGAGQQGAIDAPLVRIERLVDA